MTMFTRLLVAVAMICGLSIAVTNAQSTLIKAEQPEKSDGPTYRDGVAVVLGEPVVRSAEQAHYLLARMHRENDALRSKPPTEDDLNASAMNGSRLDIFRHTLSVAVGTDAAAAADNRIALGRYEADTARKRELETRLAARRGDLLDVVRNLSAASVDRARLAQDLEAETAGSAAHASLEAEVEVKDAEIKGLEAEKVVLDAEIAAIAADRKAIEATPPAFSNVTEPSRTTSLPGSALDKLVEAALADFKNPRLHASAMVDNHVQLQYEIIAKQLGLLKDDVGPGNRLVFLEIPTSIYTVPGDADDRLVHVEWRIKTYERRVRDVGHHENRALTPSVESRPGILPPSNRGISVLETIPQQSALNVNATHATTSGFNFLGKFLGFFTGGSVDYVRQRDLYSQYVHQDVFASGFGKGTSGFGWTFGPLPGTKRVAPGTKVTHAVVRVPSDAARLVMDAHAYAFKKSDPPEKRHAIGAAEFTVRIPSAQKGFYVEGIHYTSVPAGQRVAVHLTGEFPSPQTGILINGVPLRRTVGIARIDAADFETKDQRERKNGIEGEFERVNANTILASFALDSGFEGTPNIALVTPQKAMAINGFDNVHVNDTKHVSLDAYSKAYPMFRRALTVTHVTVIDPGRDLSAITAVLHGTGFVDERVTAISVNGVDALDIRLLSPAAYEFDLADAPEGDWNVTIRQDLRRRAKQARKLIPNPFRPTFASYKYLLFERDPSGSSGGARAGSVNTALPAGPRIQQVVALDSPSGQELQKRPLGTLHVELAITRLRSEHVLKCVARCVVEDSSKQLPDRMYARIRVLGDPMLLRVRDQTHDIAHVFTLSTPEPPSIDTISPAKATVETATLVTITGAQLQHVTSVMFGTTASTIVQQSPTTLQVKVTPKTQGTPVVMLKSEIEYLGRRLSNAGQEKRFTFEPKPKEKKKNTAAN